MEAAVVGQHGVNETLGWRGNGVCNGHIAHKVHKSD
jgi:hypothetical protein